MGLIKKVAVVAGGYYLYKEYQEKKRVEREFEQYRNAHEGPANRDFQSQSQVDIPRDASPSHGAPAYSSMNEKHDYTAMSGAN